METSRRLKLPLTVAILALALLPLPRGAGAEPRKIVDVEGARYSVEASLGDNLKTFAGRRVSLTLASGERVAGTVKDVGPHFVHLEKTEGKEFFDTLVRLDAIQTVEARFRKYEGD